MRSAMPPEHSAGHGSADRITRSHGRCRMIGVAKRQGRLRPAILDRADGGRLGVANDRAPTTGAHVSRTP